MILKRLSTLLKVHPEEGPLVALVGLLFLCIQAGQGMGDNAASALFFLRYGVEFLPLMYLFLGAVDLCTYPGLFRRAGTFQTQPIFSDPDPGVNRAPAGRTDCPGAAITDFVPGPVGDVSCMGTILGTFTWNLAGEVSDRARPNACSPCLPAQGFWAACWAIRHGRAGKVFRYGQPAGFLRFPAHHHFFPHTGDLKKIFQAPKTSGQKSNFWGDLRSGFDFVSKSSLMKLVAFASILFSILFFAIAFPFSKVVSASFPDEAGVAGFLGLFSSITTAVTFMVSLLLSNRIYSRLGIVNSV